MGRRLMAFFLFFLVLMSGCRAHGNYNNTPENLMAGYEQDPLYQTNYDKLIMCIPDREDADDIVDDVLYCLLLCYRLGDIHEPLIEKAEWQEHTDRFEHENYSAVYVETCNQEQYALGIISHEGSSYVRWLIQQKPDYRVLIAP